MRRIRDCLRLYYESKLSQSQISRTLKISRSTVQDYLSRLTIANLTYDQISGLSDYDLEQRLYSKPEMSADNENNGECDYEYLHKELQRPGVTLRLLWEEHRKQHPDGHQYSQFCWHYQQWRKKLKVYMRQNHKAGERVYVDYSGKRPSIVNRFTGEIQDVELFVMCWGCSQYTYAEAQPSQQLKYWIMGHVRAFEFFGCAAKLLVPDNMKGAVTKAHRYDPDVNPTYTELSEHYGIGVLPARPNAPRDKAKVESSVQIVQRWILARLRNRVYHSIEELNVAIGLLLEDLNNRPMQKIRQSRKQLFEELDLPNALKLPIDKFTYRQWYSPTINLDYHIEIEKRYYSVPWNYYGKKITACLSEGVLSVYHNESRIAIHNEQKKPYCYATLPEHMPSSHRSCYDWSIATVISKARGVGPSTEALIKKIIGLKVHPQQGFRPSQGILRLATTYGNTRLEAAAVIALKYNFTKVDQISSMLKNGKDQVTEESTATVENNANVRGQEYYTQKEGNK
jgi:transposase